MIRCLLAVCAESVVVDQNSNSASVFNILEMLRPEYFPAVIPKFVGYFQMTREIGDPEDVDASVVLKLAGNDLLRNPIRLSFKGVLRTRAIFTVLGFMVPNAGMLRCELEIDGEVKGGWEMECVARPAQLKFE
jgi:hypothetical protein